MHDYQTDVSTILSSELYEFQTELVPAQVTIRGHAPPIEPS
ncbi:MAG: hypothetical protein ACOC6J_11545 [Spirochaetota bacterium]